jgi:hypothetical protein
MSPAFCARMSEPEKLESALKPLLWMLIPFVLVLLYGFLSG